MGVIPVDEIGGAIAAIKFDARNVERGILDCTGCKNHRVVMRLELIKGDVGAVFNVAKKANVATVENFIERANDSFDAWMIWSDTVTH